MATADCRQWWPPGPAWPQQSGLYLGLNTVYSMMAGSLLVDEKEVRKCSFLPVWHGDWQTGLLQSLLSTEKMGLLGPQGQRAQGLLAELRQDLCSEMSWVFPTPQVWPCSCISFCLNYPLTCWDEKCCLGIGLLEECRRVLILWDGWWQSTPDGGSAVCKHSAERQ